MKKFYLLVFLLFNVSFSYSQHLKISAIGNFPDTAYEAGNMDTIFITVVNTDSLIVFNDTLDIFLQAGNNAYDTMYTGADSIAPYDSVTISIINYQFTPAHFDDGDNIIVVWPAARNTPLTVDSAYTDVYFISRLAGIRSTENIPFRIYPNPSTKYLQFEQTSSPILSACIYDLSARKLKMIRDFNAPVLIEDLLPGEYIIRMTLGDGMYKILQDY